MLQREEVDEQVGQVISDSEITMIGSVDKDGFPNMKAFLKPREISRDYVFYFSTNTSSMRVKQFMKNNKASIYFCIPNQFIGVMLKGTMEVLMDQAVKDRIWRDGDTIFYPLGRTDPDYCVLKFTGIEGRYYQNLRSISFTIPGSI